MAEAIKNIRTNYVDFYAGLMQNYTEMYEAYNEYVQKASADAVKAGEDGNNVNFNNDTMKEGYDKFNDAVNDMDLGSVANWNEMTDAQKASMTATLEPAFKVDQSSGKISFTSINITPGPIIQAMAVEKCLLPATRHGWRHLTPLAPGCKVICSHSPSDIRD
jgi:invasin D